MNKKLESKINARNKLLNQQDEIIEKIAKLNEEIENMQKDEVYKAFKVANISFEDFVELLIATK